MNNSPNKKANNHSNITTSNTEVVNNKKKEVSVGKKTHVVHTNRPVVSKSVKKAVVNGDKNLKSSGGTVEDKKKVVVRKKRVQLIDDKPKLHAIIGKNGQIISIENKKEEEHIEVLELKVTDDSKTAPIEEKNGVMKTVFLFTLFGGLLLLIIFLPDISSYIETQKYLRNQPVSEKITTGTLKCFIKKSIGNLDHSQTLDFSFSNSQLTKLKYVTETRGNIGIDDAELDALKAECDQLDVYANKLDGIYVSCELLNGTLTRKQTFNYSNIIVDKAVTAYIEAGGVYPEYENNESIDDIEKDMNASGYTCKRIK